MAVVEGAIEIDKSPDEVWEHLRDICRLARSTQGVTEVSGSPWEWWVIGHIIEALRGRLELVISCPEEDEVVDDDLEWSERVHWRSRSGSLRADLLVKLEHVPNGANGTKLTHIVEISGRGLTKLVEFPIRWVLKRDMSDRLQAFKDMVEGTVRNSRLVAAPRESVWYAWTNGEQLQRWWWWQSGLQPPTSWTCARRASTASRLVHWTKKSSPLHPLQESFLQ